MKDASEEKLLTWEKLIYVADFLDASNEKRVALLGGEPSLHPDFVDFILYLLARDFHVDIFTSGIMTDSKLGELADNVRDVHPEQLSFVCNINHPSITPADQAARLDLFLKTLGHLTCPGFNIYKPDFELDFLFQYINRYGLKRHMRLGLAHPIAGKKNLYLKVTDMKPMADRLIEYFPQFLKYRVTGSFDCGIPMCIFSERQIGLLFKIFRGNVKFECGPAIDIGPDLGVWSCFPLSSIQKKSLYDFDSLGDLVAFYQKFHDSIKIEAAGILEECDTCIHREGRLCTGGCLAHAVSAFMEEAPVRKAELFQ